MACLTSQHMGPSDFSYIPTAISLITGCFIYHYGGFVYQKYIIYTLDPIYNLGGGFTYFWNFHPENWGR